jgi:predicted lipid-binding transport protein (Tim44 family)|tara:strand:+ start:1197 stop:1799 length:603 start_codon:yes stop_codon:yes gene_type:complete
MSSQFGFIDIILLALFAGFIILRLRNILGRKTGHQGKMSSGYFPKGVETLIDIEKNESIKNNDVDEEVKKNFLKGANVAYEQIITSLSKGDKRSLKSLLGKEIYTDFSKVIDDRNKQELKYEMTFVGIKSSKVIEFKKIENIYKVTVNFVSEIISCVKDKNDKIIEGNPDIIRSASDVWKFSKNMWSQDPTWYLVEASKK